MNTLSTADTLREVMRAYVRVAMQALRDACPEGPPDVLLGADEWRRDSDGIFRLYDQEDPYWAKCLRRLTDQLHQLAEYDRVVAALRATPYANELLDKLVGSVSSRFRMDVQRIADRVLWDLAREGGLAFEDDRFDRAFATLDRDVRRRTLSFVSLAPLLGAKAEAVPIVLSQNLEIDRMTDQEVRRCLSLGILPNEMGLQRMRLNLPELAIRLRSSEDLYFGDLEQREIARAGTYSETVRDRLAMVVATLRLFKKGRVSIPGIIRFTEDWPVSGATSLMFANPGMHHFNEYMLSTGERTDLQALWQKAEKAVSGGGAIANAIRRFSYANERDRPDDALVDYMISAESLFLSDVPGDRGEMRYRLSHRAAVFIDSREYTRREVFAFMRRAYNARSAVVHGAGAPDSRDLRAPKGETLTLHDFATLTGALMSEAIRKAVFNTDESGRWVVDWDALTFPGSDTALSPG